MPLQVMLKKLKLNGSTRPSRINTQNRCPFHYRVLECKSRKSRHTWNKGKFGLRIQNEAGERVTEFCQENTLVIANTLFQQDKRRLYTKTSVQFSRSVVSDPLRPHGMQHAKLPCPSPPPGACSDSCPLSR